MATLPATQTAANCFRALIPTTLQGLAFWSAWHWYGERALADSADALGLAILLVLVVILTAGRPIALRSHLFRIPLTLPTLGVVFYALGFLFLPPLLRSAIAIFTLGASLYYIFYGRWPGLAVLGVLSLSLPVIPSLQFYLGYPLRLAAIAFTAPYLQAMGYAVEVHGTYLHWQDMALQFDAPCSGIKMLWAGLFSSLLAAIAYRLPFGRQILLAGFAFIVFFLANVIRAASLFFLESGLLIAPASWHDGIGLMTFVVALPLVIGAAHWLARTDRKPQGELNAPVFLREGNSRTPSQFGSVVYGLACLVAAAIPTLVSGNSAVNGESTQYFPGWPREFQGQLLTAQPLTAREAAVFTGFPGKVARFDLSDGRQLVLRWVTAPSRLLHPAEDCYRAIGFTIEPIAHMETRPDGRWRCFIAEKEGRRYRICERIESIDGTDRWTDIGHWYWAAMFAPGAQAYWAYTLAEQMD